MSEKVRGHKRFRNLSDSAALAREYAALGYSEKRALRIKGRVATLAGRHKVSREKSSFGFGARDHQAAQAANLTRSFANHAQSIAEDLD